MKSKDVLVPKGHIRATAAIRRIMRRHNKSQIYTNKLANDARAVKCYATHRLAKGKTHGDGDMIRAIRDMLDQCAVPYEIRKGRPKLSFYRFGSVIVQVPVFATVPESVV